MKLDLTQPISAIEASLPRKPIWLTVYEESGEVRERITSSVTSTGRHEAAYRFIEIYQALRLKGDAHAWGISIVVDTREVR